MFKNTRGDIRFGLRLMWKDPAFTAAALVLLAASVAVSTIVYSLVRPVLTGSLPFSNSDQLVALKQTHPLWGDALSVSLPNFLDWRSRNGVFEDVGAYAEKPALIETESATERLWIASTSSGLFQMLGLKPRLGRLFEPADDQPGTIPAVILGDAFWKRSFGGSTGVVGRTMRLDGRPSVIVGVMPPGFRFPLRPAADPVELWTSLPEDPALRTRESFFLRVVARLKKNVSIRQAQDNLSVLMETINREAPPEEAFGVRVVSLSEDETGDLRTPLGVFSAAVGLLLLTACANLSGLLLAKGISRQPELAVRHALGATRWRLTRQLLVETLFLSLLGGGLGVLLAYSGLELVTRSIPEGFQISDSLALDVHSMLFALATSVLCGLLVGIIPAWPASRSALVENLSTNSRTSAGSASQRRLGRFLVVVEVALAAVLLTGSGLLIKSFWRLVRVDGGFDPSEVLTARVWLPESRYAGPDACLRFYRLLAERVAATRSVVKLGAIQSLPLGTDLWQTYLSVEGQDFPDGKSPVADFRVAWGDYFEVLAIPVRRGRGFEAGDTNSSPPVAIVNESLAARLWPGREALGKRIRAVGAEGPGGWAAVVGVVADVANTGYRHKPRPAIYRPFAQFAIPNMDLVARVAGDPVLAGAALKAAVAEIDGAIPTPRTRPMEDLVAASLADDRYGMTLISAFAATALLLGLLGIYGVTSFSVRRSRREIGIRAALGAETGQIARLFLFRGAALAGAGLLSGLAAAALLADAVRSLLFGVSPRDPWIFVSVAAVILLASGLACYWPSRQAARLDPVEALRSH